MSSSFVSLIVLKWTKYSTNIFYLFSAEVVKRMASYVLTYQLSINVCPSQNIYFLYGTVAMIMIFFEGSIRWSSTSRPFTMPPSRVTPSKPVLPDWDFAFNVLPLINFFPKNRVFARSISFFSWNCPINGPWWTLSIYPFAYKCSQGNRF